MGDWRNRFGFAVGFVAGVNDATGNLGGERTVAAAEIGHIAAVGTRPELPQRGLGGQKTPATAIHSAFHFRVSSCCCTLKGQDFITGLNPRGELCHIRFQVRMEVRLALVDPAPSLTAPTAGIVIPPLNQAQTSPAPPATFQKA